MSTPLATAALSGSLVRIPGDLLLGVELVEPAGERRPNVRIGHLASERIAHARSHLKDVLSVDEMAAVASLRPRQFSRAFTEETGQSPAKAVEQMRVEAARMMMEDGRHPMDVIAAETGFADRERMRRAFMRVLGEPPQTVRRYAFCSSPCDCA